MHGLVNPPSFVVEQYKDDNSVIFFYDSYYIYKGVKNFYTIEDGTLCGVEMYKKIKSELLISIPTYTRWNVGVSDLNVDFYRYVQKTTEVSMVLQRLRIKCLFFFTSIPHHIPTEIFCSASNVSGIKSVFLYNCAIGSYLIPIEQYGRAEKRKVVKGKITDSAFLPHIIDFFQRSRIALPPEGNVKQGLKSNNFYFSIFYLIYKKIRKSNVCFLNELSLILNHRQYLSLYKKNTVQSPSINTGDIVIAAHFQPEATTFPEGLPFSNHLEIISLLRLSGFKGKIFYKEHPASQMYTTRVVGLTKVGLYRDSNYINALIENEVTILPLSFNLNEDNLRGAYVLTITGSIALERADRKLKTIICGSPWYGMPPYCISLLDFLDNKNVSEGDVIEYLSNLVSHNYMKNNAGIGHPNINIDKSNEEFLADFECLQDIIKGENE